MVDHFCYLFIFTVTLIYTSYSCDIWKAAECPPGPSKDDDDLMKSHLYTEEQLLAYCDSGRTYASCVNEHLLCCDMRSEYAAALASIDVQLKRNAVRVGRYCPDVNESNPIQYKCRTTIQTIPGRRHRRTTTATPVCNIEKAGERCSPLIENRVRFNRRWSAQEKAKWCKDTYEYHTCATNYVINCTIGPVAADVAQLNVFLDYIEKSANRECPGGLYGCADKSTNDTHCQDRISYFLEKNALANHTTIAHVPLKQHFHHSKKRRQPSSFPVTNEQRLPFFPATSTENPKLFSLPLCDISTGLFYSRDKPNMNNQSNVQEYRRYRDAQSHSSRKTSLPQYYHSNACCYLTGARRSENEYSRYRDSYSLRRRSVSQARPRFKIHTKCRSLTYDSEAQRSQVSDDKVPWDVDYPDYKPVEYTTSKILRNPKADSPDPSKITKYNQIDNKIDRRSFTGLYAIDPITNRPLNPIGRTGMTGRGRLYHWGPNHAGDPVVTRWKRDGNGLVICRRRNEFDRLKPVLEFVAIQRRDNKQWALPGGMVDPGENVSETVKREFQEEALREGIDETYIKRLFSNGHKLFESYVDDPRNTDNAWMESIAMHFHDETGQLTAKIDLNAGDDAEKAVWCPVDRTLELYACHKDFLKAAVDRLDAFW
ncbi:unnamed protein product [Adineta ricciae]|uniref:Nudix hydrolase domain-containing protein n=1 Tax=Adineta ricciae TaxID=249248 RepID=A0A815DC01_ADIRI|nr:unnamed protein product [Adineta ricciae]